MVEFKEHILKNGIRLVMSRRPSIPSVIINTSFHVGSKNEEPEKTGLTHLFEHLMFTGSRNISQGMFDEILNANGGESNAFTTQDYTSYYLSVPSSRLELGMWLDSDRFESFPVNKESLEIQKKVVIEEKMQVHDNAPFGSLEQESNKRLFPKSGYGWQIIGDDKHIRKFTINDVQNFFDKYYSPSNAFVTIAGDIDYNETLNLAEKYYGGIENKNIEIDRKFEEDEINESTEETIKDNITLPARFVFYRIPEAGTEDYYTLKLISTALSSGESSRIFQQLVSKNRLSSEAYTYVNGMENSSIFCFNCFLNDGKVIKDVSGIMDEILDDVIENGLKDEEITKSINKVETSYYFRIQTSLRLADSLTYYKMFFDDCSMINTETEKFKIFDNKRIKEAAGKYLNKNKRVILNYIPGKNGGANA
ncbi:MAG: pitrilysin family protein [Ignavibacteria bacterium]|nr:pitrilysin family protein [Ignavibacteria bacterium]